jgi:hypothetical protein
MQGMGEAMGLQTNRTQQGTGTLFNPSQFPCSGSSLGQTIYRASKSHCESREKLPSYILYVLAGCWSIGGSEQVQQSHRRAQTRLSWGCFLCSGQPTTSRLRSSLELRDLRDGALGRR